MSLLVFFAPVLIFFVLGCIFGSFLNVVIMRSIAEESWISGRSRCDNCRKTIAWYDNIPLLSYLILRGKCRHCKTAIAISHPIVEGLTGVLFVWWYVGLSLFFKLTQEPFVVLQPLFWLAVAALLIVIFFTDLMVYLIPDKAVAALMGLVFVYKVSLLWAGIMQPLDFLYAGVSMVISVAFFFLLWFVTRGKGLGFGDVKLIAPLSFLLGWPSVLVGIFSAFILGSLVGIGFVVVGKKKLKQPIPFGPFLIIGTVVGLLWGHDLFAWYLSFIF